MRSWFHRSVAIPLVVLALASVARGAATEPRFAIARATVHRSSTGAATLELEASLSFADTLQLSIPLDVVILQGILAARFDLSGNVFTTTGGNPEQPAPGPGVIAVEQHRILLALPPGFTTGPATVQLVASFDGKTLASNRLGFSL